MLFRSNHKNACPKKDAEETFAKRAPYDEKLELTFQRRQKVNIDIPEEVQAIADEIQEEESKDCLEGEDPAVLELDTKGDDDEDDDDD